MKSVGATVGGLLVTLVVYLFIWFFVRNMVEGPRADVQIVAHVIVILIALAAGYSSYRSSMRRR